MSVYVDTSALLAVLDRDDDHHPEAARLWQALLAAREELVTTNYVLLEATAILQHRIGLAAVRTFEDELRPVLTVAWVTVETHDRAIAAVLVAACRRLSLVDCIGFDVIRSRGIRHAFAFDRHFTERGYGPPEIGGS